MSSRRELFGSLASRIRGEKKEVIIRPPYFIDKDLFDKECHNCEGRCATFCQEGIVVIRDDKTPQIDFTKGGCTYCDECSKACEKGVLEVENRADIKASFEIDVSKCLSWHKTMCFSCKDPCAENAIEFLGLFRPQINSSLCTSCGMCVSVCPSDALIYKERL